MRKGLIFGMIVFVLFCSVEVSAANFYVDGNNVGGNGCSDSGTGTLSQPWCTIDRARRSQGSINPGGLHPKLIQ